MPELSEALPQSIRILDFQEGEELVYRAGQHLDRVSSFSLSNEPEQA